MSCMKMESLTSITTVTKGAGFSDGLIAHRESSKEQSRRSF